jgi:hypothetical protein
MNWGYGKRTLQSDHKCLLLYTQKSGIAPDKETNGSQSVTPRLQAGKCAVMFEIEGIFSVSSMYVTSVIQSCRLP